MILEGKLTLGRSKASELVTGARVKQRRYYMLAANDVT
jgi:hypothetical protein